MTGGDVIVLAVLTVIVGAIIAGMIRSKKKGTGCCGSCAGCSGKCSSCGLKNV